MVIDSETIWIVNFGFKKFTVSFEHSVQTFIFDF
jgi:hypothetical protein